MRRLRKTAGARRWTSKNCGVEEPDNRKFLDRFRKLPQDRQDHAREIFELWRADPYHRSLHFKRIAGDQRLVSARIGKRWRVVGAQHGDIVVWFWIGPHHEYDRLIGRR